MTVGGQCRAKKILRSKISKDLETVLKPLTHTCLVLGCAYGAPRPRPPAENGVEAAAALPAYVTTLRSVVVVRDCNSKSARRKKRAPPWELL